MIIGEWYSHAGSENNDLLVEWSFVPSGEVNQVAWLHLGLGPLICRCPAGNKSVNKMSKLLWQIFNVLKQSVENVSRHESKTRPFGTLIVTRSHIHIHQENDPSNSNLLDPWVLSLAKATEAVSMVFPC